MQLADIDQIVAAIGDEMTLNHSLASDVFERACRSDGSLRSKEKKTPRSRLHKNSPHRSAARFQKYRQN